MELEFWRYVLIYTSVLVGIAIIILAIKTLFSRETKNKDNKVEDTQEKAYLSNIEDDKL